MSTSDNGKTKKPISISDNYSAFIDVLFAVVIGQSFVLLIDKEYYRAWFDAPLVNLFGFATLILVYGLVVSSWVGYHQSIKTYSIESVYRFMIDIILLFLYYLAFASAANFWIVLITITASFLAYLIWDSIRIYEKRKHLDNDLWKRLTCTGVFFIAYAAITIAYTPVLPLFAGMEWVFLIVVFGMLIGYRYIKWYRIC